MTQKIGTEYTLWKRCEQCGTMNNAEAQTCRGDNLLFVVQAKTKDLAPMTKALFQSVEKHDAEQY